jgi:serpin B
VMASLFKALRNLFVASSKPARGDARARSATGAAGARASQHLLDAPQTESQKLAASSNALGFDLYEQLRGGSANLALSPASISAALCMTYGGARGETEVQMRKVLHLGTAVDVASEVGDAWRVLMQSLLGSHSLKLRMANRLFGESSAGFEASFLALTEQGYGAPLERLDFKSEFEASRLHINRWVEIQTENRIRDLLPPQSVDASSRLVLVNAVYFLADWQSPFEKDATRLEEFTTSARAKVSVAMMRRTGYYELARLEGVSVLELPYRGGLELPYRDGQARCSMLIALPDAGLDALEQRLSVETLMHWRNALASKHVALALPRFEVSPSGIQLKATLAELGMKDAFDVDQADFSGISKPADPDERLAIGVVIHKAFVKVDEKGTEAAAATAVGMLGAAGIQHQPELFRVDRPFLYVIIEQASGLVLFMGRVNDPTQK